MNIFYLSTSPAISAVYLCDQHIVKMMIESSQMISTCLCLRYGQEPGILMRPSYVNHPCNVWIRENPYHLEWLVSHLKHLLVQYEAREFNTGKPGYARALSILHIAEKIDTTGSSYSPLRPVLCMPEEYKDYSNPVQSYRNFYMSKALTFKRPMRYVRGEIPDWFDTNRSFLQG